MGTSYHRSSADVYSGFPGRCQDGVICEISTVYVLVEPRAFVVSSSDLLIFREDAILVTVWFGVCKHLHWKKLPILQAPGNGCGDFNSVLCPCLLSNFLPLRYEAHKICTGKLTPALTPTSKRSSVCNWIGHYIHLSVSRCMKVASAE